MLWISARVTRTSRAVGRERGYGGLVEDLLEILAGDEVKVTAVLNRLYTS